MKKTIKLAVAAALALGATSAFATNGANLIGVGAKARGMGGVGIGVSHGAESTLANPALITSVKDTEISFAGTIFMPNVKNNNTVDFTQVPGLGFDLSSEATSEANMNVIPSVSIASKITENFYMGVGIWGTAGMGVDFRDTANTGQFNMVTNLQIMQFGLPLAYKTNGVSVAVTPVLQYGSLDMNYNGLDGNGVGAGVAQDLQFGYNLGLAYEIKGFTVGATYKSQIDMNYDDQLSSAMAGFLGAGAYTNEQLSTPAEIGLGIGYTTGEHTIGFDYKNIAWSSAKGYEDFKWKDQNVYAIGYEFATKSWALRAGYNYSESPIEEQQLGTMGSFSTGLPSPADNGDTAGLINALNLLGFPATVESHITLGGTYNVNEKTSFDLAFAYAPETTNTFDHFAAQPMTVKHSQTSVSAGVNFAF